MKKFFSVFVCALILVLSQPTICASRTQWWQKRVTNLEATKEKLSGTRYYHLLSEPLEKDLRASARFTADLNQDTQTTIDLVKIDKTLDKMYDAYFASSYLKTCDTLLEHTDIQLISNQLLEKSLQKRIEYHHPTISDEDTKSISQRIITRQTTRSFSYEITLLSLTEYYENERTQCRAHITKTLLKEYKDQKISSSLFTTTLLSLIDNYLKRELGHATFRHTPNSISNSPAWRDIVYRSDLLCSKLSSLKNYDKRLTIKESLYFIDAFTELEQKVFPNKIIDGDTAKTRKIKGALDKERRRQLARIPAQIDPLALDELIKQIDQAALEMSKKYGLNTSESEIITNYSIKNQRFLQLTAELKREKSADIEAAVRHRFTASAQMIAFYQRLLTQAYGEDPALEIQARLLHNCKRYKEHLTYISYSITILPLYKKGLTLKQQRPLLQLLSDSRSAAKSALSKSSLLRGNLTRKIAIQRKEKREKNSDYRATVGNAELVQLAITVKNYYEVYRNLSYANQFLTLYNHTYNELNSSIKKGIISAEVTQVVTDNTLLPQVKADSIRVDNEYQAKKILANAIKSDIVHFTKLCEYYRSQNIELNLPGERKELYAIQAQLAKYSKISIGSFIMHEENFRKIDQKLVMAFESMYRKKVWEKSSGSSTTLPIDNRIISKKLGISYYIPEGWVDNLNDQKREHSITYENSLDLSRLSITEFNSNSEQEAVNIWLQRKGFKTMQLGWSTKGETLYLWKIARDKSGNIAKIFAFKAKDRIILVAGVTTKKRYPFFHNRIDTVFNSVEI